MFYFISLTFTRTVFQPGTNELICQNETFQLVRRFFRQALTEIAEDGWQKMDALIEILVQFPINEDRSDGAFGLRLHFADIYLEELSRFEVSLFSWRFCFGLSRKA